MFDRASRRPDGVADPIALFGRATIDYERGQSEAAIDGYVAVLRARRRRGRGQRGTARAGRRDPPEHAL